MNVRLGSIAVICDDLHGAKCKQPYQVSKAIQSNLIDLLVYLVVL